MFEVFLLEKPLPALSIAEVRDMLDSMSRDKILPLEIENPLGNSVAIGFITDHAAEELSYDYRGLAEYLGGILADVNNETEDWNYSYQDLRIFMGRNHRDYS